MKRILETIKKHFPVATAMLGHALEHYEVTLYGFFAVTLAPLFFPNVDRTISLIGSMGIFAMGFVMRPLGGLVFGHFGDLLGRKKCLLFSVLLAAIPTILIGLLPTYESIGIAAPLLLVLCRLAQGFSLGGEYSGAIVFISEHSRYNKAGFVTSLLLVTGFLGAILGTLMGALFTLPVMPEWGWRLAFIFGGVLGLGIYFLRRNLPETPVYENEEKVSKKAKVPLLEIYKTKPINALCTVVMGAGSIVTLYTGSIYLNPILINDFGLSTSQMMLVNTSVLATWAVLLPIFGYIGDKISFAILLRAAASAIFVLAIPLFFMVAVTKSLTSIFILQGVLCIMGSAFLASAAPQFPRLFKPLERYSGVAFHVSLGQAILGGTTPLIAASLVAWTGNPVAPGYYLMFCGFLGIIASFLLKPVSQNETNSTSNVFSLSDIKEQEEKLSKVL